MKYERRLFFLGQSFGSWKAKSGRELATVDLLDRLDGVKEQGGQWTARCPGHDDRVASLAISRGDDGRWLLHCHAGCSTEDVVAALGLSVTEVNRP